MLTGHAGYPFTRAKTTLWASASQTTCALRSSAKSPILRYRRGPKHSEDTRKTQAGSRRPAAWRYTAGMPRCCDKELRSVPRPPKLIRNWNNNVWYVCNVCVHDWGASFPLVPRQWDGTRVQSSSQLNAPAAFKYGRGIFFTHTATRLGRPCAALGLQARAHERARACARVHAPAGPATPHTPRPAPGLYAWVAAQPFFCR